MIKYHDIKYSNVHTRVTLYTGRLRLFPPVAKYKSGKVTFYRDLSATRKVNVQQWGTYAQTVGSHITTRLTRPLQAVDIFFFSTDCE